MVALYKIRGSKSEADEGSAPISLEDFIKDLDPDLQERARACGSAEELLALAKDAKVPLPDEALAAIAGGDQPDPENCRDPKGPKCPACGSTNTVLDGSSFIPRYLCLDCYYQWIVWE